MQKSRFWSAAFAGMARVWNLASGRVVFGLIEIFAEFLGISGKNWNCELCTFILYFWKMAFANMSHLRYNIFYTSDNNH